jgi:hypothetical protein
LDKVVYNTSDLDAVVNGFTSIGRIDEIDWDYEQFEGVSPNKTHSSGTISTDEVIQKLERDEFHHAAIIEDEDSYQKIVLNYADPRTILEIEPLDERLSRFDGYFN